MTPDSVPSGMPLHALRALVRRVCRLPARLQSLFAKRPSLDPEGAAGIAIRGHRGYVGGYWDEIGQLQFEFLLSRGLRPEHVLLDIACGSLRLGVKAIPYLEPGHYLGMEKEPLLVQAGLEQELTPELRRSQHPVVIASKRFDFERFALSPNYAIAHSLFTHLPARLIHRCFRRLHPALAHDGVFYATFFCAEGAIKNPLFPHDHGYFAYTQDDMIQFGVANRFSATFLGDWGHPRGQVMVEYRKRL